MRKIINSATTQYEPVLTEELVLDDRPISGSFNSITSDAVYKAISVDPGNVPPVESTDDGKVLTASYGEGGGSFEWSSAPNEVPAVGENDNAKVLTATYSEGTGSFAWAAAPSELPDTTGASQGDVLSIGSSGLEWATPSGGGVTKQVISLTGATHSGDTTTTFTFNLASANQFYALGKQVSVSYKAPYFPMADPSGSKIKLYYESNQVITLDATTYSNMFCASVFVGNETNISYASDPSLGYKFTKVEIVVPIHESDWINSPEPESLKIQILG